MRGRKPTPTALKILRGNPGHRPLNDREPQARPGRPSCPRSLPAEGRKAFRALVRELDAMGIVTKADAVALELLANAYAEWREARDVVEAEGQTYETVTQAGGRMVRVRPEVLIAADAWRRIKAMLTEYGLTASSRSRVKAPGEAEQDEFEDFINGGGGRPGGGAGGAGAKRTG